MKNKKLIQIAKFISDIFNPGVLALIILFTAVYRSSLAREEAFAWYLAILVVNGLIPGVFYLFFTSRGYVFDDTLKNKKVHKERILLLGLFLVITVIEVLIMSATGNYYQPLYAVLVGGIISIIIAAIVSYFWKVSMHSSMITFFTLMVIFMFGPATWPVLFLIPLVWWSRLILCRHTIWQLIIGSIISIIIVYFTFHFFSLI